MICVSSNFFLICFAYRGILGNLIDTGNGFRRVTVWVKEGGERWDCENDYR